MEAAISMTSTHRTFDLLGCPERPYKWEAMVDQGPDLDHVWSWGESTFKRASLAQYALRPSDVVRRLQVHSDEGRTSQSSSSRSTICVGLGASSPPSFPPADLDLSF